MLNSIKTELRKILTVRSTYFILLISLAIAALFAGYGDGFKADAIHLQSSRYLASESANGILFDGIILALVGLLLLGHEYRYNTILYTLTGSKSRAKSLLAKFVVITIYALIASTIVAFFAPLCMIIGTHLAHKHLVAQVYPVWQILWKCWFVGWGYAMYAFIITAIIRSQVGSIVTFLLVPLIGEHIIEAIFKNSDKFMPFTSLQAVVNVDTLNSPSIATLTHNVVTTLVYIGAGLVVSFVLFIRRDAN